MKNLESIITYSISSHTDNVIGKGKVHPLLALRLCTGRMAYKGSRDIAVLFLDRITRRG
jgi:hypothetical protein